MKQEQADQDARLIARPATQHINLIDPTRSGTPSPTAPAAGTCPYGDADVHTAAGTDAHLRRL